MLVIISLRPGQPGTLSGRDSSYRLPPPGKLPYSQPMPSEQLLDLPLHLSPAGRLRLGAVNDDVSSAFLDAVTKAFRAGEEEGLFELAARPPEGELSPLLGYWRDFAARYLTERCHSPIGQAVLEPLGPLAFEEAGSIAEAAPPMEGAEYLGPECLQGLWASLDAWLLGETEAAGGLETFLAERAPLWRQVGRVCFHLAENKKDPEFPFAFLATYAPRLESAEKVRYQPLSRALQEFAGESNRRALLQLLTPISLAAERSSLVRELLDSGDIYQPLAWSPAEAHRFLGELPLFEESGVLVRVPDWWASRPRPQVSVTIGSAAVGSLDASAILDFRIGIALGGESLDAEELEEIRAVGIGLALLKGRWVEVDAAKLDEALKLWKRVEIEQGQAVLVATYLHGIKSGTKIGVTVVLYGLIGQGGNGSVAENGIGFRAYSTPSAFKPAWTELQNDTYTLGRW